MAMVACRILAPQTKLATTRWWHTRTLAEDLGVTEADEDDLYEAMDWLLSRQTATEKKLSTHKLHEGSLKEIDGLAWITALKTGRIRALMEGGHLQLGLFDKRNLFEGMVERGRLRGGPRSAYGWARS